MNIVFFVFMGLVVLISSISVSLVLRDIIEQIKIRKAKAEQAKLAIDNQPVPETNTLIIAHDIEIISAPVVATTVIPIENGVTFALSSEHTLEEKYAALPQIDKEFYDGIARHAAEKEKAKLYKTVNSEEYKIGNAKLIKLSIKREFVTCEFFIPNSDFKNYITANKVKFKQRSTVLRVIDNLTFNTAKDTIDLVERLLKEDAKHKKELLRELRKVRKSSN